VLVFSGAVLLGYGYTQSFPGETARYMEEIRSYFGGIDQSSSWQTFLSILQNNVDAMALVVALGVFAGLLPFFFLAVNGLLIGLVAGYVFTRVSPLVFLAGILPHGWLELPSMIFAAAIGLRIGETALKKLLGRKAEVTAETAQGIRFAVLVILPLLVGAAFIEAFITPAFIALAQFLLGA
jgi:stage II sporulation protein M